MVICSTKGGMIVKKAVFTHLMTGFLALCMILSLTPQRASAFTYRGEIRVGLANMASEVMDITLAGNFSEGENRYLSGTSYKLTVKNGKVMFNGKELESFTLIPEKHDNMIKIRVSYISLGRTLVKEYSYRGRMRFSVSGGQVFPINTLDVEEYLKGVVPYEMSNSFHIEALKAQAVAARNYAIANLDRHSSSGYDLDDTTHCQVYRGYNDYYKNSIRAVEETAGMVLLYKDKLVNAYYSASDGGYTEACENVWVQTIPYLKAKPDIYDNDSTYDWVKTFTEGEIEKKLRDRAYIAATDKFIKLDIENIKTYESGRISKLDIVYQTSSGQQKVRTLSKESARIFLSLNSAMYTVTFNNGSYTFSGKGSGHGIGMSQIGALARAKAGQAFDTILAFYYDGAVLETQKESMKSFDIDKNVLFSGNEVIVNAEALVGRAPLFKYVVKRDNKVVYTGDYTGEKTFKYSPQDQGDYTVEGFIKDKNSRGEYDDTRSLSFKVYNAPVINEVVLNPTKIYMNKSFNVKVTSQFGSGNGIEYKFDLISSDKVIESKASGEGAADFTLAEEGQYEIRAYLKDKLSSKEYDALKSVKFTVEREYEVPKVVNPEFTFSRTLKLLMSGNDVKELQRALETLGFFKYGTTTTYFGTVTEGALKSFQTSQGLGVTGILDARTAEKINAELIRLKQQSQTGNQSPAANTINISRTLKLGMTGEDVKVLQTALEELGNFNYYTKTTYFGTVTQGALKSFQSGNGLAATGILDSKTVEKINSELVRRKAQAPPVSQNPSPSAINITRTLKPGMVGVDVKALQKALETLGYFKYHTTTTYFGDVTKQAVVSLQKKNGLVANGTVDSKTVAKINVLMR
jgi:SpoIID/LytB domain protein